MKIGFLPFERVHGKQNIGSSRIRVYWITKNWEDAEVFKYGQKYDIIVYQKVYYPRILERYDGLKILDVCDPDWIDNENFMKCLPMFDAVVTSSAQLKDFISTLTDVPVINIQDGHDLGWYGEPAEPTEGSGKNAAWFGFSHNASALIPVYDTLKELEIKLTIYSDRQDGNMNRADNWVKYDPADINENLKKHDMIILPHDIYNANFKYKTNNKEVSCWGLGVPVAKTKDDLLRLMDYKQRVKDSKENRKKFVEKYDVKYSVDEWKKFIKTLSQDKHDQR